MIKFVQCVRKKPNLSFAEFRDLWGQYRKILQQLAETVDAVRCSDNMALAISENVDIMLSRGTQRPFDAVAEIWVATTRELEALAQTQQFQELVGEMQSFQEKFLDLENSSFFFTSEEVLFER